MTPARVSLIVLALSISLNTGVFGAEAAKPVAPLRLEARINGERWTGDLDGIAKRRILRILVVPSALGFYFNGAEMRGAMFELGRDLANSFTRHHEGGEMQGSKVRSDLAGQLGELSRTPRPLIPRVHSGPTQR